MGLAGWPIYRDGVFHHNPVPPSIEFMLEAATEDQAEKLELLCDIAFNIDALVTPELAKSGRLHPFVYCWIGTLLRYWPLLLRRFKRESKSNGALCSAVIMSGMSDNKSGSAEKWLNESGLAVRDCFHVDNLTAGSGGPGSVADFGSVVTAVQSLSSVVQGFSSKMDRDNAAIVPHLGRVTELLEDTEFKMSQILQALARSGPSQTPSSPATGTRSRFNNSSGSSSSSEASDTAVAAAAVPAAGCCITQKKQWTLRKMRWPGFWQWMFRSPLALS